MAQFPAEQSSGGAFERQEDAFRHWVRRDVSGRSALLVRPGNDRERSATFSDADPFDAVYHGHFKCNLRRSVDYPSLWPYLRDLYQHDGVAETVNFDHIKRHYYITHEQINPTRIVPIGPALDLDAPHSRG